MLGCLRVCRDGSMPSSCLPSKPDDDDIALQVLPTETMQPGHQWPKAVTKDMAEFGGNYLLNSVKFPVCFQGLRITHFRSYSFLFPVLTPLSPTKAGPGSHFHAGL